MERFIDLHMHSLYSDDGEFAPAKLVSMCKEAGVRIMAVADHNSVRGVKEAGEEAERLGIACIPALEIDCTFEGINLHVAGYGIDSSAPVFGRLEKNILNQEKACSDRKLVLTNELGFDLSREQMDRVSANGVFTGEMFGEVLLNDSRYADHELLLPYRAGGARGDNPYVNFYWDYYSQGKPCYTKVEYPSLKDAVEMINGHGGVAVLAHPGNNLKGRFQVFDRMVQEGLQGVEAFSSYHDRETAEYFLNKGRELGLLITCGSDFHGKTKPAIHLGETGCTVDQHEMEEQLRKYGLI